jgi:hypothetical protein
VCVSVGANRGWRQTVSLVLDVRRHVLQLGQVLAAMVGAEQQLAT